MHRLVASWFGTGLIPHRLFGTHTGAGTVASVFALLPAVALGAVGWWAQLGLAVVLTAASLWAAAPFARDGADPNWVGIDEAAGTAVSVVGLGGLWWLPSFVAFRVFDATKWAPGVRAAERWPGSLGLTADDVLAGGWGLALGWTLRLVIS